MLHIRHFRKNQIDGTLAVVPMTKTELHHIFTQHANKTMMSIGLAIKSPHDQFIKKVGYKLATEKMAATIVDLICVSQTGTKHIYTFDTKIKHTNNKTYQVVMTFTTVLESENVELVDAYIFDTASYSDAY